jgi:CBS domain-containing protein
MTAISDIIDRKGALVLSVDHEDSVLHAIRLMADVNIGAVLVTQGNLISGIFTERDYLQKVALDSRSSKDTRVSEVMSTPVITARPEDTVQECLEVMTNCRCRHLPVVDGEELLGIVSIGDLVKRVLDEKESEIEQLSHYIAGSY